MQTIKLSFTLLYLNLFFCGLFYSQENDQPKNLLNTISCLENKTNKDQQELERLVEAYKGAHRYDDAITTYQYLIESNFKTISHTSIKLGIAFCYYKKRTLPDLHNSKAILDSFTSLQLKSLDVNNLYRYNNILGLVNWTMFIKNHAIHNQDEAFQFFNKSLYYAEKTGSQKKIGAVYNNIGNIYQHINASSSELEKSTKYFQKALEYTDFMEHKDISKIYHNIGINYYLLQDYPNAIRYINKAMATLVGATTTDFYYLPSKTVMKASPDKNLMARFLFESCYSWIQLAKQENNPKYYEQVLRIVDACDYLYDAMFLEVHNPTSKLHWRSKAVNTYLLGVLAAEALSNSERAFYYMEKNKSLVLLEQMRLQELQAHIPDSVYTTHRDLQQKVLAYDAMRKDSSQKQSSVQNYWYAKQQWERYRDSVAKIYPDFLAKKVPYILSLDSVQQRLPKNHATLSYIWEKQENQFDALYGLYVDSNQAITFEIKGLPLVDSLVQDYRRLLREPHETKDEQSHFYGTAHHLFQKLIPPKIAALAKDKNITIVADSDLQTISFEALVTDSISKRYWMEEVTISYANSLSYLQRNQQRQRKATKGLAAFAPVRFSKDSLRTLQNSEAEVQAIQDLLAGQGFTYQQADSLQFAKSLPQASILHLATHADASAARPWIALADGKMYLEDLYGMDNQADLVCLSACQTSLREIASGEGVMSLSRGFFHGGAKSVVSSLWNVDDSATKDLMQGFYSNLKERQTKSQALGQAKRDYLATAKGKRRSPYYWASMVLVGDGEGTIVLPERKRLGWYALGIGLLVLVFGLWYSSRRKERG